MTYNAFPGENTSPYINHGNLNIPNQSLLLLMVHQKRNKTICHSCHLSATTYSQYLLRTHIHWWQRRRYHKVVFQSHCRVHVYSHWELRDQSAIITIERNTGKKSIFLAVETMEFESTEIQFHQYAQTTNYIVSGMDRHVSL